MLMVAGLVPSLVMLAFGDHSSWQGILHGAAEGMLYSLSIGTVCWMALTRSAGSLMQQTPLSRWGILLSIIAVSTALGCCIAGVLILLIGLTSPAEFWSSIFSSVRVSLVISLVFGCGTFFYEVVKGQLIKTTAALEEERQTAVQLRQIATEARLSSLESRVHPHFLFNTLNSISALIREEPARAERMVEQLASLLRFSLDSDTASLVPLQREVKIVRDYLEIEKARFGDRLRYRIEVPTSLDHISVPSMSIQTLVENSVKYAVSSLREGAFIEIRAQWDGTTPTITVIDDGPGFEKSNLKPGHGLDLLRARIGLLFGPEATLEISSEGSKTAVTVLLPQKAAMLKTEMLPQ